MAKYTPKAARERGERFITSWQTNSPDTVWDNIKLADHKAKGKAILDVEAEIEANDAKNKALMIKRDNLNEDFMKDCDYIAAAVEGSREYGPDSALYAGFGSIRDSDKKRGGGRKKTT